MRGKIIMWNNQNGAISASGKRFDFDINMWQGSIAPRPDMTVALTLSDDALIAVDPVPDADVMKEKMNEVSKKGGDIAMAVCEDVGRDTVIAYAAFAVFSLCFNMVSGKGLFSAASLKLADLLNLVNLDLNSNSNGHGAFIIILACATIVIPYFWKNKASSFAFCTPMLLIIYAAFKIYRIYSSIKETAGALFDPGVMQQVTNSTGISFSNYISIHFVTYIIIALAAYLAFRGITRFLAYDKR